MAITSKQFILISVMLFVGTLNTITRKTSFDSLARGYYNYSANGTRTEHNFNKPWFQTFTMFFGEIQCFLVYVFWNSRRKLTKEQLKIQVSLEEFKMKPTEKKKVPLINWIFLPLAICDLLATIVSGIGLLYIDASIWQIMRGSLIVFAGILSVTVLRRKLRCFHWTGMLITMCGLVLVGAKSIFSGQSTRYTPSQSAIGVVLVLFGAFTSAAQMIVEEIYLKRRGYHPLQAVGTEGIFGTAFMLLFALPVVHFIPGPDLNGSYENIADALFQLGSNAVLLVNAILYLISMAWFNYCGFCVAKDLSTVHRTLVDALRTAFVWIVSLILYYTAGHQFGEPFEISWGLIELNGFALLVIGTLIYNQVMDLSFIPVCQKQLGTKPDSEQMS
ncbi:hypothetical protein P879_04649 [Paragonimus westermani]|uniref:Solute carrier family 35 member F6 n=1 Tax=Paragonimus westermani TaxID=34504 RepID=A0A8T0DHG1_9TREM|nr:hypothetical protein P879_04649 [Paragonimus westermani]